MKLNQTQITQIKDQLGADPLPEQTPGVDALQEHFGDHTFYVDEAGLHIFELDEPEPESEACQVRPIRVASWTDDNKKALAPHNPIVGQVGAVIKVEE